MTKIDWDGGYKGNKDNSTGFFIGPMAEFTIPIVGLEMCIRDRQESLSLYSTNRFTTFRRDTPQTPAKSAADAAKEAAATAKAEAIQAAVDKVNEMLKDAPSQEALDRCV